jgi:hypothetical protein
VKLIEFLSAPFLSTDDLETGIETFTNTLRSAKIAGQVNRPHEAIKHFPDLSELVAKKRQIRKRFQRCRQRADKMELNRLTNLIHNKIREFRIQKFEKRCSNSQQKWYNFEHGQYDQRLSYNG